jgi:hypothetical protein
VPRNRTVTGIECRLRSARRDDPSERLRELVEPVGCGVDEFVDEVQRDPDGPGPGGRGRGGWQVADLRAADDAEDWFRGRLPSAWFSEVEVTVDREEILVVGTLAEEAQSRYQRKVSWGARLGASGSLFTHVAAPVMTRLRQPERRVLDTLVDAGVARSRSDALAWSVRLVGEHVDEWLGQLREAMSGVDKLRSDGPGL